MNGRANPRDDAVGAAIRLRPANSGDLSVIERIVHDAYSPYIARIGGPPAPMGHDYAARIRDGVVTIAEGEDVVGLIVVVERPDHLFIENVAVSPGAQHRGIGRTLLGYAEDRASSAGLGEVRLYTNVLMTENQALYKRLGYVEVGRVVREGFGRVQMAKAIGSEE